MKQYYVISHTHWDREWYMPLELMRLRLVDLMDNCIKLLDAEPEYIFHLDAQTVVLEDYLSIRADQRPALERLIREGRLIVGPWYLQNDFYLTSGEATIRNLLEGKRIAEHFGKCSEVGYCADQFGLISQLPQILRGFGVDNCVFGRGAARVIIDENGDHKRLPFPSEFIWEGADGSSVTAIHMSHWYNNAQHFSADIEKAERLVKQIEGSFEGITATPYLLLMNGVDHLEAQEDLLPILRKLDARMGGEGHIFQSTLEQYVANVKQYIESREIELYRHEGELRSGGDWELLKGTLSSRIYLKQRNVAMQNRLEGVLEPLYAMLERSGMAGAYSLDHFRYLWRELMKNHPHDSICGCSRDEIHAHMEDNFARLEEMSGELLRRGMDLAANHVGLKTRKPEDYGILVANTRMAKQNGVVYATLDFPEGENVKNFTILDKAGIPAEHAVLSKKKAIRDIFSPINLPGGIDVDRYTVVVYAKELSPMSLRAYTVRKTEGKLSFCKPKTLSKPIIENDFLKIEALPDGQIHVTDKKSGRTILNAFDWEETADTGDSYVYCPSETPAIYAHDFPAEISAEQYDLFTQSLTIRRRLVVPKWYDFQHKRRSKKTVGCTLTLTLTLEKGNPAAIVDYEIDNRAEDHRVRLLAGTGLQSTETIADTAFDVIRRNENGHWFDTKSRVYPNTSFVAIEENGLGAAILTCGQHEYEHLHDGDGQGRIALTVVRGTGVISHDMGNGKDPGDQWVCPGNQCLRRLTGRIGLWMYTGSRAAEFPSVAKALNCPAPVFFFSNNPRKFAGGRPAVQDTAIGEIFYRPDPFPKAKIDSDRSFLRLEGEGVAVTAFKKAEDGNGHILRMFNAGEAAKVSLQVDGRVFQTDMAETKDVYLGENEVRLTFGKQEIKTLRIL